MPIKKHRAVAREPVRPLDFSLLGARAPRKIPPYFQDITLAQRQILLYSAKGYSYNTTSNTELRILERL